MQNTKQGHESQGVGHNNLLGFLDNFFGLDQIGSGQAMAELICFNHV